MTKVKKETAAKPGAAHKAATAAKQPAKPAATTGAKTPQGKPAKVAAKAPSRTHLAVKQPTPKPADPAPNRTTNPAASAKARKPATDKMPTASGKPAATPTPKTVATTTAPVPSPRKQDIVKNSPNPIQAKPAPAKPTPQPQDAQPAAPKPVPQAALPVAKPMPAAPTPAPAMVQVVSAAASPAAPTAAPAAEVRPPQAPPRPPMPPGRPIIAPRLPAKAEIFVEGDYVVYPTHGVGKVERIAIEEIAGHKLELIHITFEENRMTLRVPVAKARSAGLRKLANRKMFDEAMAVLRGKARIKRTMWSRRAQEYEAKINSGDPIAIAEVVRDLHRNAGQPDQSFSERQIYEAAMDRLAAELAALDRTDKPTAAIKLNDFLKTIA